MKSQSLKQHFVPNMATLIAVAMMFLAYHAYTVWAAPTAQGTVPTFIPYQGTLTDASGNPIDGSVNLTFRLYNTLSGGTALWTESHTNVPVSSGLFNVRLGSKTAFADSVWQNASLYLGIQVGSEAEMTPREPLGAVPVSYSTGSLTAGATFQGDVQANNHSLIGVQNLKGSGNTSPAQLHMPSSSEGDLYLNWHTGRNIYAGFGTATNVFGVSAGKKSDNSISEVNLKFHNEVVLRDDSGRSLHLLPWGGSSGRWDNVCIGCGTNANLVVHGSVTNNALIEGNLQTPAEKKMLRISRFSQGDVLCWSPKADRLEICAEVASPLVVAVADVNGKPMVLGAEPIKVMGSVKPGDLLVASDKPGYAVAWSQVGEGAAPTGVVIAKALEPFTGDTGLIKAMVAAY